MIQRFLQASGKTGLSMVSLIVGAGTNIILDPIFIFTFGIGVRGAAIATVIGQWLGAATALLLNNLRNPEVKISFRGFRLEKKTVAAIYKVGFPTIIMQAMGSVMNFGMNALLGAGTAVAFFGAYFRLQSFLFMPMNGLGQACLPIIGYNYGAKNPDRIRETVKTALKWGIILGLLFTALFMALPGPLLSLFNASEEMLSLGVPAIRIICVTFALASITMILGLCASGLSNGTINMIGTAIRQVVLLLPCFALLKTVFGLPYAWFAMWIAEISAMLFAVISTRITRPKRKTKTIKKSSNPAARQTPGGFSTASRKFANPDLTIFLPLAVVRVLPSKTAIFEKRAPVVAELCHLPAIRLPGCVFTGVMSKQAQKKQKREAHKAGGK